MNGLGVAKPSGSLTLVPAAQREAVQRRLDLNHGQATRNLGRPYLLRGFIWCAVCGRRMRPGPEHGKRTYRCSSRETPAGPCGGSRVPAEQVEAAVWAAIDVRLRDPGLIASEAETTREKLPDDLVVFDLEAARRSVAQARAGAPARPVSHQRGRRVPLGAR